MTTRSDPYHFAAPVPPGVKPAIPGPDQESVWDYPRPPRLELVRERIRVVHGGIVVADTLRACRVLEASHPPGYYIPREDVRMDLLRPSPTTSHCEWKGAATYWSLTVGAAVIADVGWSYERPAPGFEAVRSHLAFYAGRVDEAWVGDERVVPQPGGFYGGWLTSRITGPVKGAPGSWGW